MVMGQYRRYSSPSAKAPGAALDTVIFDRSLPPPRVMLGAVVAPLMVTAPVEATIICPLEEPAPLGRRRTLPEDDGPRVTAVAPPIKLFPPAVTLPVADRLDPDTLPVEETAPVKEAPLRFAFRSSAVYTAELTGMVEALPAW